MNLLMFLAGMLSGVVLAYSVIIVTLAVMAWNRPDKKLVMTVWKKRDDERVR